jgi:hypothetical protein
LVACDSFYDIFIQERGKMKDSVSAFLEIIGYIIGIITFVATVSWMIIRGKVNQSIHAIWSERMKAYEDDKEEGRELRRQSILTEISSIKESLNKHESNAKEDRNKMLETLESIREELVNSSKLQVNHEGRILNLEKSKK